jgi:hypothetical protein
MLVGERISKKSNKIIYKKKRAVLTKVKDIYQNSDEKTSFLVCLRHIAE